MTFHSTEPKDGTFVKHYKFLSSANKGEEILVKI